MVGRTAEGLPLSPEEVLIGLLEGVGHDEVVVHRESEVEGADRKRAHPGEIGDREAFVTQFGLERLEDVPYQLEVLREDDHRVVPDVADVRAGAVADAVVCPEYRMAMLADTDFVLSVHSEGADVALGCAAPVPDLELHGERFHGPLLPVDPEEVSEHPALPLAHIIVVSLSV